MQVPLDLCRFFSEIQVLQAHQRGDFTVARAERRSTRPRGSSNLWPIRCGRAPPNPLPPPSVAFQSVSLSVCRLSGAGRHLGESWLCRCQHVSPGKTVGPPHISNARVHPGWMHRLSQCDGSRFGRRAPGWGPGPPRLPRPSRMSAPLRGLGCALAGGV